MKVIDQILLEWSFRCPDGIVDMNNPKKVKILFEIIKPMLTEDIDDDILNSLINLDPDSKTKAFDYIQKLNKKEDTDDKKVIEKLHELLKERFSNDAIIKYISLVALRDGVLEQLTDYLKSPNKQLNFNFSNKKDNLLSILKKTNFNEEFITEMLLYTPLEKGKSLGIGEVAIALFFKDAQKKGAGDIEVEGKLIELKGTGARFPGKEGTDRSGNISDLYSEFKSKYPDIEENALHIYIKDILEKYPNDLKYINNIINDELFPNSQKISIDLKDEPLTIKYKLNKKYVKNYVDLYNENDYYMLVSKSTFDYNLYNPTELIKAAEQGEIRFKNMTSSASYANLLV